MTIITRRAFSAPLAAVILLSAIGCTYGVYGYLGYPTAWLMDQLQGDAYAHKAFVKPAGEFSFQISNWLFVDSNVR